MKENIIIHYNEIALKGKNRPYFEKKLRDNIKEALKGLKIVKVSRLPGRILVELGNGSLEEALALAARIPGISSYSPALKVKSEMKEICKAALDIAELAAAGPKHSRKAKTFKIETKRGWKQFPKKSMEISAEAGEYVMEKGGLSVDVKRPQIIIRIEVLKDASFVYSEKIAGAGGLPKGSSGKMLVLISGGIDSPVASYLMMRRGVSPDFIHFHSYPYTDRASIEKVEELAKILSPKSKLYLAPIIDFQKETVKSADPKYRIILYRRLMYRVAEALANKIGAKALVSGDNLGQVASQTIENMAVVGHGIKLPIIRPLVAFDKEEIIAIAKKINTYEVSIERHDDCCSIFSPKNPATKSRLDDILKEEKRLKMDKWANKILKEIEKN